MQIGQISNTYNIINHATKQFIPYETIQSRSERGYHPSTFPIQLPEMCIELHGVAEKDNLVVLDPFCGTGSTAVACKDLEYLLLDMI